MADDVAMTATAVPAPASMHIDPAIFTSLQAKIDEEAAIRDELKKIIETLTKQGRVTQSVLSRIHNTPTSELQNNVLNPCGNAIADQCTTIRSLSETASKYPFYKWNQMWSRDVQNVITSIQLANWLGSGKLITLEDIGTTIRVPVNQKTTDVFHLTIEDYLLALTSMIEELARLAPNAVTLGDLSRPLQISKFIKDVHAGFQLLNLKNDILRKRSDSIKYSVKKVEDVVYDLSLRGLIPK